MTAIAQKLEKILPNPDWAKLPLFDRKGWKTVRFGDVVRMLKEQVDPVAEGVERYVAGEHMETENVHIRKWGNVGDGYLGPAFIRQFRKGQVLYGSRRTYLKKVAVPEWDGVTANTTFVLEASEGKLLQELLPWLMLSERFTKHSIQESKGSTNPYINFPDIAKFQFALPPLDQQRRIAEILWAVDEAVQSNLRLRTEIDAIYSAATESMLFDKSVSAMKVADLSEINSETLSESRTERSFRFNYIDIGSVIAPKKLGQLQTHEFATAPSRARRAVKEGDILISTVRPNLKAFVRLGPLDCEHVASTGFAVITPRTEIIGRLLFHGFFSRQYMTHCESRVIGTSYPAMNAKDVGDFVIHLPKNAGKQEELAKFLDEIGCAATTLSAHIIQGSNLLKQLVESIQKTGD